MGEKLTVEYWDYKMWQNIFEKICNKWINKQTNRVLLLKKIKTIWFCFILSSRYFCYSNAILSNEENIFVLRVTYLKPLGFGVLHHRAFAPPREPLEVWRHDQTLDESHYTLESYSLIKDMLLFFIFYS